MAYTETKTTSYGTRLGNSIKGILGGILLVVGGTVLLWCNEGRAVKTADMLEEGAENTIDVEDVSTVDASLNGQLIHATAEALTTDSISDETFGVGVIGINLTRKVEFYQYVEESKTEKKDKIGGSQEETTTYTYKKEWVSSPVNSQDFKDPQYQNSNSVKCQLENYETYATNVSFGGYKLPENFIHRISGSENLNVTISDEKLSQFDKDIAASLGDQVGAQAKQIASQVADSAIQTQEVANDNYKYIHVSNNVVYIGRSSSAPEIGDIKVTFTYVKPHEISLIAKVNGDTFENYVAKNGKSLSMIHNGKVNKENMYNAAEENNTMWTWILRLLGVILVCSGLRAAADIFVTLAKVLPFLADIVNTGLVIVTSILGIGWSLLIIAIAWLFYRPVLSLCILAGIIGLIVLIVFLARKKKAAPAEK